MNLLFIIPYVPNLVRVRSYNFIRFLRKRGHHITLATLWTNEQDLADIKQLEQDGVQVVSAQLPLWKSMVNSLQTLPGSKPVQARYNWQPELAEKIKALFVDENGRSPFEAIHVEHLRGACFGLSLKSFLTTRYGSSQPPIIWDSVDCISLLFEQAAQQSKSLKGRLMTQFELGRTKKYEAYLATQFTRVLLTSPLDRQAYLKLLPTDQVEQIKPRLTVLPNGVDLDYFCPDTSVSRKPDTLVVTGKMSYHANVTMVVNLVQDVMPLIWKERPDIKLQIVGKDPPKQLKDMAENPQIEVTGTVDDLRPYLRQATLSVAPITYGAGIQNKVLEAMACSAPVVASSKAVSALNVENGRHLFVGSGSAEIADLILKLVNDPTLRHQIGENGHRFVTQQHNWELIAERLETFYDT